MSEIAIKVENLNKIYKLYDKPIDRMKEALSLSKKKYSKDHYALKDISFEIEKGETIGIVGVNGSGKSTLLKIITGVLTQTSGYVQVNGKISALLELGAGFNPEYTGLENIYLNGTMMGYSKEDMDDRVQPIVEFADIGEFINQPVKTYSSGMFARLAFAVAINVDPDILIVDEALSVGDVFFQSKCYARFADFKKTNKSILFVSHDLNSIIKYCDRVILLNNGIKVSDGGAKEIIDIYKKMMVGQLDVEIMDEKISNENNDIYWKEKLEINPKVIEYGNMNIKIIDYAVENEFEEISNVIEKGSFFSIKLKIKFYDEINEPIIAFTIKDLKGNELSGTNTLIEKIDLGEIAKGCTKTIVFKQKMLLQGGDYLLSLGCTTFNAGTLSVYHRLYDVINLKVISLKNSIGYFDMYSEIMIV